jgi:hypothetical protein
MIIRPRFVYAPDGGGAGDGTSPKGGGEGGKTTPGADPGQGGKTPQDKAGADSKTTEPPLPDDPAQLKALLAQERAEKAHLLGTHTEMKTKYEQREAAETKAREENLKKQGEFQKLLEEQTPKYEAATAAVKRYEEILGRYLEVELKAVPENLKALMPEGDPAVKLDWIAKAKAAGTIAAGASAAPKKPGDGSPPPGGSTAATMTRAAFDALSPADRAKASREGVKLTD